MRIGLLLLGLTFGVYAETLNWKLEGPEKEGSDVKEWAWVAKDKKVPVFSAEFAAKVSKLPKVFSGSQGAVFHFPRRGIDVENGKDGAVAYAKSGETADKIVDLEWENSKLTPLPSNLSVHDQGFYFSSVIGAKYYLFSYLSEKKSLVLIHEAKVDQVRESLIEIQFENGNAVVKTGQRSLTFDSKGSPLEASVVYSEATGDNLNYLANSFRTSDWTKEAGSRRFAPPKYTEAQLKDLLRLLNQKTQQSVLLVEKHFGVESQTIVEALANFLASEKGVLRGQKDWKVVELPWKSLNTEGQVDLTIDKVTKLLDTVRMKKVVLFIPEIDQLQGLGVDKNATSGSDAASVMSREIQQGKVIVIGQTNIKGLQKLQTSAKSFSEAFSKYNVNPPSKAELHALLMEYATLKGKSAGIQFDDAAIKKIIERTDQFLSDTELAQPGKSKSVINALSSSPAQYGVVKETKVADVNVLNYLAERTGIGTLAAASSESGIKKLLNRETFFKEFDQELIGHKHVKEAIWKNLTLIADATAVQTDTTGLEMGVRTLFLLGPSGTGKSYFPEVLSKILKKYGVVWDPIKFEMSKWSSEAFATTQTGAPPSYVGFEKSGGEFISKLRKSPQTIFVFEEFDKAHRKAVNPLYDLLEFGRFQDANLNEVSISRSLVFVTSNFGAQGSQKVTITGDQGKVVVEEGDTSDMIDQYDAWKFAGVEPRRTEIKKWNEENLKDSLIQSLIDNGKISPQVIGRVQKSNVMILHHFSKDEVKKLIAMRQRKVAEKISVSTEKRIESVEYTPEATDAIFDRAWGNEGKNAFNLGARAVLDITDKEVYFELGQLRDKNQGKKGSIQVSLDEKKALKYVFVEKK